MRQTTAPWQRQFVRETTMAATLIVLAFVAWWFVGDRPTLFSGDGAQARALRDYIEAARRNDCPAVLDAISRRTREVARATLAGRMGLELGLCNYSPAPGHLSDFESDRIRVEGVSGSVAHVSASYTYERLFGFFGRGRDRYTYTLVLEDGRWRIDLAEQLDPGSPANRDQHAMSLVQHAWTAITDHRRETGKLTSDPDAIRNELPGFEFPAIEAGVVGTSSPVDTLFVTTGPSVACVSLRSASGTLVMLKIPSTGTGTYQYGAIPADCDDQPLSRPYHGASSGIQ